MPYILALPNQPRTSGSNLQNIAIFRQYADDSDITGAIGHRQRIHIRVLIAFRTALRMKVHIQHCDLHLRKNLIEKRQRFRPMDKLHFQTFVGRNPHDSLHQPQHDQNDQSRNDSRSPNIRLRQPDRCTPYTESDAAVVKPADMPFGKHDCTRAQKADTGNHGSGSPCPMLTLISPTA